MADQDTNQNQTPPTPPQKTKAQAAADAAKSATSAATKGGKPRSGADDGAGGKPTNNIVQQVVEKINANENILVALSNNPSVDEMAGAIGLTMLLDAAGKRATSIYSGETPNVLQFLEPEKTFETNTNSLQDFIIALNKDKADHLRYKIDGDFVKVYITPYRTTIDETDLSFSHGDYNVDLIIALNVDSPNDLDGALSEHGRIMHDASAINITTGAPGRFGEIEWSDPGASSVSEMIVSLANALKDKVKVDQAMATALLTGIVAETERFSNEKTTPNTMSVAARLMQAGADQTLIAEHIEIAEEEDRASLELESDNDGELDIDNAAIEREKQEKAQTEIDIPQEDSEKAEAESEEAQEESEQAEAETSETAPGAASATSAAESLTADGTTPAAEPAAAAEPTPTAPVDTTLTPEQQLEQLIAPPADNNGLMNELSQMSNTESAVAAPTTEMTAAAGLAPLGAASIDSTAEVNPATMATPAEPIAPTEPITEIEGAVPANVTAPAEVATPPATQGVSLEPLAPENLAPSMTAPGVTPIAPAVPPIAPIAPATPPIEPATPSINPIEPATSPITPIEPATPPASTVAPIEPVIPLGSDSSVEPLDATAGIPSFSPGKDYGSMMDQALANSDQILSEPQNPATKAAPAAPTGPEANHIPALDYTLQPNQNQPIDLPPPPSPEVGAGLDMPPAEVPAAEPSQSAVEAMGAPAESATSVAEPAGAPVQDATPAAASAPEVTTISPAAEAAPSIEAAPTAEAVEPIAEPVMNPATAAATSVVEPVQPEPASAPAAAPADPSAFQIPGMPTT